MVAKLRKVLGSTSRNESDIVYMTIDKLLIICMYHIIACSWLMMLKHVGAYVYFWFQCKEVTT